MPCRSSPALATSSFVPLFYMVCASARVAFSFSSPRRVVVVVVVVVIVVSLSLSLSFSLSVSCRCVSAELQKLLLLLPYRLETFVARDRYQPPPTLLPPTSMLHLPIFVRGRPYPLPTFPRAQSSLRGSAIRGFQSLHGEFIGRRTRLRRPFQSTLAGGAGCSATERSLFHDFSVSLE